MYLHNSVQGEICEVVCSFAVVNISWKHPCTTCKW